MSLTPSISVLHIKTYLTARAVNANNYMYKADEESIEEALVHGIRLFDGLVINDDGELIDDWQNPGFLDGYSYLNTFLADDE